MDAMLCAACGHRSTGPVRLLDTMPGFPGRYGGPGPDGPRRPPAGLPRGTCENYDGVVPGGGRMCDERGGHVSAGPRRTHVRHPLDVAGLDRHLDHNRDTGCRGPDGRHGVDRLCRRGAEVAVVSADCTSGHETRLVPDAVRVATEAGR